jgi:dCMP deaminase
MALAKLASMRSGCNSRPTGAVIVVNNKVIATGYNGSLPGQPQCTDNGPDFCYRRSVRKDDSTAKKYIDCRALHAEQNALNQLCGSGSYDLSDAIIYSTLFPCKFCLQNLISVGIRQIRFELDYESSNKDWDDSIYKIWKENDIVIRGIQLTDDNKAEVLKTMASTTSERRL